MKKIDGFNVNHKKLLPGVYVFRKDKVGNGTVTTFDIRITRPNHEPVLDTSVVHAIEHLGATFLRNHKEFGKKIIFFGPLGCRTGFYLLLNGDYESNDIIKLLIETFEFMSEFENKIPGSNIKECGNYLDMDLNMLKYNSRNFLNNVLYNIQNKNINYPD